MTKPGLSSFLIPRTNDNNVSSRHSMHSPIPPYSCINTFIDIFFTKSTSKHLIEFHKIFIIVFVFFLFLMLVHLTLWYNHCLKQSINNLLFYPLTISFTFLNIVAKDLEKYFLFTTFLTLENRCFFLSFIYLKQMYVVASLTFSFKIKINSSYFTDLVFKFTFELWFIHN